MGSRRVAGQGRVLRQCQGSPSSTGSALGGLTEQCNGSGNLG